MSTGIIAMATSVKKDSLPSSQKKEIKWGLQKL